MTGAPFNLKTLLFDFLLSAAAFIISEIIGAVFSIYIMESREEGLGISFYTAIPLSTIIFYAIRRRFKFIITAIQIILSIALTFLTGYVMALIYRAAENDKLWLFILLVPYLAFVITKHLLDQLIMKKGISKIR